MNPWAGGGLPARRRPRTLAAGHSTTRSIKERLILDTSVFNVIEALDAHGQERVLKLLDPRNREIRMTWEAIQEVVSVAGTRKASRLPVRCRLLHTLVYLPPYLPFTHVVRSELAGDTVFFSSTDHWNLQSVLEKLAGGHAPAKSLRELHLILGGEKRDHREGYLRIQTRIRERMRGRPSLQRSTTFEGFSAMYWKQWSKSLDTLIDAPSHAARLSLSLEKPRQFPYSHAFLRTHVALLYRHLVQNRRVGRGDVFDAALLVCLAGMDTLITEDRGLHELGTLVWGASKQIMCLTERLARSSND